MHFDTRTTLIAICTIVAVLGIQTLFFWFRDRRNAPWLAWFALALVFGSAAVLLYLLPTQGNEFLMLGLGNAVRIYCFVLLWHGTRSFAGRRPEHLVAALTIAVWLAACSIPAFLASMPLRMIFSSLVITVFCGLSGWELWRIRAERLPSLLPAAATYVSFALFSGIRVPLVNLTPFPVGALPASGPWVAAFGLVVFVHATFIAMLTLSMTRERREQVQRRHAMSDPLTGLLNRRAFLDEAARAARAPHHDEAALALLVLDLDDFKSINDRYGHDAGDRVLEHFADIARGTTRLSDQLYRMGGEEFCFLLPNTKVGEARQVAERIRTRFAATPVDAAGESVCATVSIGIAAVEMGGFDLELLLAAGDAAVYQAKALGRNQTVVADRIVLRPRPAAGPTSAAA